MAINGKLIEKSEVPPIEKFQIVNYTGNGGTQFVPTEFKGHFAFFRTGGSGYKYAANAFDGNYNNQITNEDGWYQNNSDTISFGATGITVKANWNSNGYSYKVALFAINDTGTTNTNGTLTSTTYVNDAAGTSWVTWNTLNSTGTVGHGMNASPDAVMIWGNHTSNEVLLNVKPTFAGGNYLGSPQYLYFSTCNYMGYGSAQFPSDHTSTVFGVNSGYSSRNNLGAPSRAWAMKAISGYSKFAGYEGTCGGGTKTVNVGFEPACVIIKSLSYNYCWVMATASGEEGITFTSTGFTMPNNQSNVNQCGAYFYMAWANA
jgi:hypothetical protein